MALITTLTRRFLTLKTYEEFQDLLIRIKKKYFPGVAGPAGELALKIKKNVSTVKTIAVGLSVS